MIIYLLILIFIILAFLVFYSSYLEIRYRNKWEELNKFKYFIIENNYLLNKVFLIIMFICFIFIFIFTLNNYGYI